MKRKIRDFQPKPLAEATNDVADSLESVARACTEHERPYVLLLVAQHLSALQGQPFNISYIACRGMRPMAIEYAEEALSLMYSEIGEVLPAEVQKVQNFPIRFRAVGFAQTYDPLARWSFSDESGDLCVDLAELDVNGLQNAYDAILQADIAEFGEKCYNPPGTARFCEFLSSAEEFASGRVDISQIELFSLELFQILGAGDRAVDFAAEYVLVPFIKQKASSQDKIGQKPQRARKTLADFVAFLKDYQYITDAELESAALEMFADHGRASRVVWQAKENGALLKRGRGLYKVVWRQAIQ